MYLAPTWGPCADNRKPQERSRETLGKKDESWATDAFQTGEQDVATMEGGKPQSKVGFISYQLSMLRG